MSYLNKGQWTNDKNKRKYRHMSVIPFPVCEYAAIHYKDGRRLEGPSYGKMPLIYALKGWYDGAEGVFAPPHPLRRIAILKRYGGKG